MLAKKYRLPAQIRLINTVSVTTPLFFCKIARNNLPLSRFGFVVRKTVDKRAIVRNRVRRVFRSCIEEMLPNIQGGNDVLFFLNRSLLEIERQELYNTLYSFLKKKQLLA